MLSTAENAVYDRQIRLWGVSGQYAIKQATTLVIGLTPVAVETCKNLVLAGSNLLILDLNETTSNFLIKLEAVAEEVGSTARRTAVALKALNPMAHISVIDEIGDSKFDLALVSLNVYSETTQLATPNLLATLEIVDGTFTFSSCNRHRILETSKPTDDALPGEVECMSFADLLALPAPPVTRRESRAFRAGISGLVSGQGWALASPAVAAVTGGLLAEECLKIFTKKDLPLLNTISVDGDACSASVRNLGARIILSGIPDRVEEVGGALALD